MALTRLIFPVLGVGIALGWLGRQFSTSYQQCTSAAGKAWTYCG
jgi:hypothetical protein